MPDSKSAPNPAAARGNNAPAEVAARGKNTPAEAAALRVEAAPAEAALAGAAPAGAATPEALTYSRAGVDVTHTDAIKSGIAGFVDSPNPRVLNGLGPFASLYDIRFETIKDPVLVLKAEEPGSKQKLAIQYGHAESVCHDLINHLVNDIAVMGARPLAVLDTIVCGAADRETITALVKGLSEACRENECDLVGGETSVQPGVLDGGVYILTASIAGIVDREKIIDGAKTKPGDKILALASNGLHTNGYTLVRMLMEENPQILREKPGGESFLELILKPHTPYYKAIKGLFGNPALHGMAHITGGGMEGNIPRVLPAGLSARIDLGRIRIPPIFQLIRQYGNIDEHEMLKTFNCGVGMVLITAPDAAAGIIDAVSAYCPCYEIGEIVSAATDADEAAASIELTGHLRRDAL